LLNPFFLQSTGQVFQIEHQLTPICGHRVVEIGSPEGGLQGVGCPVEKGARGEGLGL
jgi:hypothetical protein